MTLRSIFRQDISKNRLADSCEAGLIIYKYYYTLIVPDLQYTYVLLSDRYFMYLMKQFSSIFYYHVTGRFFNLFDIFTLLYTYTFNLYITYWCLPVRTTSLPVQFWITNALWQEILPYKPDNFHILKANIEYMYL